MDTQALIDRLYADPAALQAYQGLSAAGGRVFIVGGAVRDTILGKTPKDIDLMVGGLPAETVNEVLKALPGKSTYAGKNFGVFHYHVGEDQVEIALPRTEKSTGAGHKDFDVTVDHELPVEADMARRDFTANAMAFDIDSQEIIDPFDGQGDITKGLLRLINAQAFVDDPLRIVRAIVAYSVHGLEPDDFTLDEMRKNGARIRSLPGDRIQKEFDKLLAGNDPAEALSIAYETGVLDYMVPELAEAMGFDQHNVHHDLDVGAHTLAVLDKMTDLTDDVDLRLAALMHDLGKPDSFWQDENGYGHFYRDVQKDEEGNVVSEKGADHEEIGAEIAHNFMKRLNYPNDRIQRVTLLVRNHMFPYFSSPAGARKLVNAVGGNPDVAKDLLLLRESDAHGKADGSIRPYDEEQIAYNRQLLDDVIEKENAFTIKNLKIDGNDLMELGVPQGPEIGIVLNQLLQEVLEDPSLNEHDTLIEKVRATL